MVPEQRSMAALYYWDSQWSIALLGLCSSISTGTLSASMPSLEEIGYLLPVWEDGGSEEWKDLPKHFFSFYGPIQSLAWILSHISFYTLGSAKNISFLIPHKGDSQLLGKLLMLSCYLNLYFFQSWRLGIKRRMCFVTSVHSSLCPSVLLSFPHPSILPSIHPSLHLPHPCVHLSIH